MSNPGEGSLGQIFDQMVLLEEVLTSVDPALVALKHMPPLGQDMPYPFTARLPVRTRVEDRSMDSAKPVYYTIPVVVLVGFSTEDISALEEQAQKFVIPLWSLYLAHRSINNTVRNLTFGEGLMGDLDLMGVKHYGYELPVIVEQRVAFPYSRG